MRIEPGFSTWSSNEQTTEPLGVCRCNFSFYVNFLLNHSEPTKLKKSFTNNSLRFEPEFSTWRTDTQTTEPPELQQLPPEKRDLYRDSPNQGATLKQLRHFFPWTFLFWWSFVSIDHSEPMKVKNLLSQKRDSNHDSPREGMTFRPLSHWRQWNQSLFLGGNY